MYVFSVRDGSIRVSDVSLRICLQYFINFASSWKPWEQMRLGSEQFSVVWYGLMWKWHLSLLSHDSASVVVPIRMNLPVRVCRSAVPWDRPIGSPALGAVVPLCKAEGDCCAFRHWSSSACMDGSNVFQLCTAKMAANLAYPSAVKLMSKAAFWIQVFHKEQPEWQLWERIQRCEFPAL